MLGHGLLESRYATVVKDAGARTSVYPVIRHPNGTTGGPPLLVPAQIQWPLEICRSWARKLDFHVL